MLKMDEKNIEKKEENKIANAPVNSGNLIKDKNANAPVNSGNLIKDKNAKEGSFAPLILVMFASLVIAFYWEKLPWIGSSIHSIFDPTAGSLLNWNLNIGMLIIVLIISIITTIVQKYATDQDTLKELRKEQKEIQNQMKEFKNHPEKMMELQKKQFAAMPKQMKLSMRGIIYTGIPFILFFRWFSDYFISANDPKFILGLNWFWFYLISAMIFSSIIRKKFDVI
jgi:uncharacterized membrane protein (DUF106 family)